MPGIGEREPDRARAAAREDDNPAGTSRDGADFDALCARIREPRKQGAIDYAPGSEDRIEARLQALGFAVRRVEIDVADYRRYLAAARYVEDFPDYYSFNRPEKALEHYLTATLLGLRARDVYIDVGSEHSPVPEIYERLFGVIAYRQDLTYRPGVHRERIGSDAARMPLPDGFATAMGLHSSLECFEGPSDMGFLREAARVLRPGGALCAVPLWVFEQYAIQTDPAVAAAAGVQFDADAVVYCARGWGNRHARFYDPEHLLARVAANAGDLDVEIHRIVNPARVDPSCYARFAMVARRPRS